MKNHWHRILMCEVCSCKTACKRENAGYTATSEAPPSVSWFSRCKINLAMYISLAISTKLIISIAIVLSFFSGIVDGDH